MSDRRAPGSNDAATAQQRDLDRRVAALESRRWRLGDYWIDTNAGNLVARHAVTGHETVIATPGP